MDDQLKHFYIVNWQKWVLERGERYSEKSSVTWGCISLAERTAADRSAWRKFIFDVCDKINNENKKELNNSTGRVFKSGFQVA